MKRSPLAQTATAVQIPSPIGGWNARDPLPAMKPEDAVILENAVPGTGGVSLRGGSTPYVTFLGAPVNALMRFNSPTSPNKLFAAAGANIFDVTNAGVAGTPVVGPQGSDLWQSINFGNPGGNWLVMGNGTDQPLQYSGTAWSAMTLVTDTGYSGPALTATKLFGPCVYGSRLWFCENNSLRVWYLPVNAISTSTTAGQGMKSLDFSSEVRLGGSIIAMARWTRDGGVGADDYALFITSAGEVLMYAGNDPTQTSWTLVGNFRIPPPIGRRCVQQAGADIAILTQLGVIPLSTDLALAPSQSQQVAITDKIRGAFQLAYASTGNAFGWEMAEYPKGALLIVNIPQPNGTFQQYVMNVNTGAWCNFTGVGARTWALSGDALFFGTTDGKVCQYDVGNQDQGAPISAVIMPAFSSFKSLGKKKFTLARPLYNAAGNYQPPMALKLDYDTSRSVLAQGNIPSAGTPWGSPWGSPWTPKSGPQTKWQGIRGVGQSATVLLNVASRNPFRLDHIDLLFEAGGYI